MKKIQEKHLANGVVIVFTDLSKKIAGDRWFVKISCLASIPLSEKMRIALSKETDEMTFVREQIGETLTHEILRERNFIDQTLKETVVNDLIETTKVNLNSYLSNDKFVPRLFARKIDDYKKLFTQQKLAEDNELDMAGEEDDLADFSSLFK